MQQLEQLMDEAGALEDEKMIELFGAEPADGFIYEQSRAAVEALKAERRWKPIYEDAENLPIEIQLNVPKIAESRR